MPEARYDLVVIGAGPAGYVAAVRAAQLGMSVVCVERRTRLGGTCLNVGCIPSKALLHSSHLYAEAESGLRAHGIAADGVRLDLAAMMARKDKVVDQLTRGVAFLFQKNGVERVSGTARIPVAGTVEVAADDSGARVLRANRIVIATGSEPAPLPNVEVDEERIVTSTGALALDRVPGRLLVVGAGYIGLELGSVWSRLGADVTVVELADRILPGMDADVAGSMRKLLARQGIRFRLGTRVTGARRTEQGIAVALEAPGGAETADCDVLLVAGGRRPLTEGLGLEALDLAVDARGFIRVNAAFATSVEGIYAIGDCVAGPMLAHKASEDGIVCVESIAGSCAAVEYLHVPAVVFTAPEVAMVGRTEEALRRDGMAYAVGRFPFTAVPRARTVGETAGFVKILADERTDRVLGVHIVGADAGTLIHEAVLAMEFGASAEDIARTVHAHPTLAEAVKESALDVLGRPIHL